MSKITFEKKKGKVTIVNRLSYPEAVNERVYNAIASGMLEGFLPVTIRQKRKEVLLECVVQGLVPLGLYFNGIVTRKMFLDFAHEMALQIKTCEKNVINANNIDLQSNLIFVDPQTKKVKCIYWPVVNNQRTSSAHLFLKQLPSELHFNPHENKDYLQVYKDFFGGINPFSVNSFDKMILKLMGRQSSGYSAPSEALSGALSADAKAYKPVPDTTKKASIEYDPLAELQDQADEQPVVPEEIPQVNAFVFCTFCGTKNKQESNFCIQCGNRLKKAEPPAPEPVDTHDDTDYVEDEGTTVLGDDLGGTTVLGYDEPEEPVFPSLIRDKTNESHLVNKPIFRIGSEQKYCDLFIYDNTYISRSHADIITRNDRYYIVDRNSTNKTYVDGKVVPVEKEIEIFPGTRIRLANEDFTFSIES